MIAGGVGSVRDAHVHAVGFPEGTALVVLGGPAMLIGLGGGAVIWRLAVVPRMGCVWCCNQKWRDASGSDCRVRHGRANPFLITGAGGLSNCLSYPRCKHRRSNSVDVQR